MSYRAWPPLTDVAILGSRASSVETLEAEKAACTGNARARSMIRCNVGSGPAAQVGRGGRLWLLVEPAYGSCGARGMTYVATWDWQIGLAAGAAFTHASPTRLARKGANSILLLC